MKALIFLFVLGLRFGNPFDFHRNMVGVLFSPYVRHVEGGDPANMYYDIEDLITMASVICTKFSRIMTSSVDARVVPYRKNASYYHDTNARARIAEAVALVNQKKKKKCLSLLIGIANEDFTNPQSMNTEVNVAVDAARLANTIFPGTVQGFVFSNLDMNNLKWAQSTVHWIKLLRNLTIGSDLEIGTRQVCINHPDEPNSTKRESYRIYEMRKEISIKSDFIICSFVPLVSITKRGAKYSFDQLKGILIDERSRIQSFNGKIQVLQMTRWKSSGNEVWENIDDFLAYWEEVNHFARKENYPFFLSEAFDTYGGTHGWWTLLRNDLVGSPDGYIEKFMVRGNKKSENAGTWRSLTKNATLVVTHVQLNQTNCASIKKLYTITFEIFVVVLLTAYL